jgi:hypothetical protein
MEAFIRIFSLLCFTVTYVLLLRFFAMGTMELLKLFRSRGFNPLLILKGEHAKDVDVIEFKKKNLRRLTHLVWAMGVTLILVMLRFGFGAASFLETPK